MDVAVRESVTKCAKIQKVYLNTDIFKTNINFCADNLFLLQKLEI